jgi:hypothetical protein
MLAPFCKCIHPSIHSTIHPATSCKLVGSNLEAAHNPPRGQDRRKVNKGSMESRGIPIPWEKDKDKKR